MNFQDFHDYAKRLKPVIKQADKLECSKFLDELIAAHPEYAEKLKVVQTCFLSFQVIHSHLFDLANDAMQIERNYRARVDAGSNPLGLKLTDKAKAMIPILVPLFVSAFRRATDLAMAMEARCYQGGSGRTKMKPLVYRTKDYVAYAVTIFYVVLAVLVGNV